jgi:two-component system response regulator PilR (NtrC family)
LQVKLLRALQERKVRRVGGSEDIEVDVRVVAATNRDLQNEVKEGRFREDLFYRLNVIQIRLPALRERKEDIPMLIEHFLKRFGGDKKHEFTPEALKLILDYRFPGNVRELENLVERAVTLAESPQLGLSVLPPNLSPASDLDSAQFRIPEGGLSLEKTLDAIEFKLLTDALERSGGVKKRAADLLGLTFRSMRYRLAKHALGKDEPGDEIEE